MKLSRQQQSQINKIKDYYTWLSFKVNNQMSCPAWDIYENNKKVATIFYFGDWRIDSSSECWGEDFDNFIADIGDFHE